MNLTILKGLVAIVIVLSSFVLGWSAASKHKQAVFDAAWAKAEKQRAEAVANAERAARQKEQDYINKLAGIDREYQDKLKAKDKQRMAALAAARSRGLYVRAACPGSLPDAATGTRSGNGTTLARLSDETAEPLVRLLSEADEVVEQLTACQAIVKADRE